MNVSNFVKEFSELVLRWHNPRSNNQNIENPIVPLTNEQLLSAVEEVLRVILGKNIQVTDYSSVTTPATGIAICTPNAPVVSKNADHHEEPLSRYRSLDTLHTNLFQSENANFPDVRNAKSEEKMEIADNNTFDCASNEIKLISLSSPSIHVTCVNRSGTFVREESEKEVKSKKSNEGDDDVFAKLDVTLPTNPETMNSGRFLPVLEELRKTAFGMLCKIDDAKKKFYPQTTKPIRRLSSIGLPGLTRSSSMMRPIPPPKLRRSVSAAVPGTPTSSKLNSTFTGDKEGSASSRKTMIPGINYSKPSNYSGNNTISSVKKKSPLSCTRPAKNPKYAHVQSTISKIAPCKRKAQ